MRTKTAAAVCLLAAAVAAGAFQAQNRPPQTPPKPAVAARKAGPSDSAIEAAIRARFAKSKINEDKFQVRVQGGAATLEGRTGVVQHKGVATRLAKAGGAAVVHNQIQISEAARQKAAANLAKGRRRAQIKRGEGRADH